MRRDPPSIDREADPHRRPWVSVTNCPQSPGLLGLLFQKASTVALSKGRGALRTSVPLCPGGGIHITLSHSLLLYFYGPVTWGCLLVLFISTTSDGVISQESSFSLVACGLHDVHILGRALQNPADILRTESGTAKSSLDPETPLLSLPESFREELLESHPCPRGTMTHPNQTVSVSLRATP